MTQLAYIAIGGALGAITRFSISAGVARCCQIAFPLGTLIANLGGCFLVGLLIGSGFGVRWPWLKAGVGVGFLGSLTTFSTFSAETLGMIEQNRFGGVAANVGANVLIGLAAVAIGVVLGRRLAGNEATQA